MTNTALGEDCVESGRTGQGESGHHWCWEPLDGQDWPEKGRYRVHCGYGACNWEKEVRLDGDEVWLA